MAYSQKEIKSILDLVCSRLEEGESLRNILRDDIMPSTSTFFRWIDDDEEKAKQYARAKELYADKVFDDIVLIADGTDDDVFVDENGIEQTNHNIIQRDRLRIDARKWHLSKLNPKKYGDKLDMTSGGDKIKTTQIIGMVVKDEPNEND